MPANPYDDRYRTGWDSYPDDYTNGIKNENGNEAEEYMNNNQIKNYSNITNSNPSDTGYTPYNGGGPERGSGRGWE
jgi:hypothetical protein